MLPLTNIEEIQGPEVETQEARKEFIEESDKEWFKKHEEDKKKKKK